MAVPGFAEFFCLKDRDNFQINEFEDARRRILFGDRTVADRIMQILKTALVQKDNATMLLWGPTGLGKTHLMNNRLAEIEAQFTDVEVKLLLSPGNITSSKAAFQVMYNEILETIGKSKVIDLIGQLPTQAARKGVDWEKDLLWILGQERVVKLFKRLQFDDKAWDEITAERDPNVEARILLAIGYLYKTVLSRYLIIMVDETRITDRVEDEIAIVTWQNGLETLVSALNKQYLGLILGYSSREIDDLGDNQIWGYSAFLDKMRRNRILRLQPFDQPAVSAFVREYFDSVLDARCIEAKIAKLELQNEDNSRLSPETFPFTKEAFAYFLEKISSVPRARRPRVIIQSMVELSGMIYPDSQLITLSGHQRKIDETVTILSEER